MKTKIIQILLTGILSLSPICFIFSQQIDFNGNLIPTSSASDRTIGSLSNTWI